MTEKERTMTMNQASKEEKYLDMTVMSNIKQATASGLYLRDDKYCDEICHRMLLDAGYTNQEVADMDEMVDTLAKTALQHFALIRANSGEVEQKLLHVVDKPEQLNKLLAETKSGLLAFRRDEKAFVGDVLSDEDNQILRDMDGENFGLLSAEEKIRFIRDGQAILQSAALYQEVLAGKCVSCELEQPDDDTQREKVYKLLACSVLAARKQNQIPYTLRDYTDEQLVTMSCLRAEAGWISISAFRHRENVSQAISAVGEIFLATMLILGGATFNMPLVTVMGVVSLTCILAENIKFVFEKFGQKQRDLVINGEEKALHRVLKHRTSALLNVLDVVTHDGYKQQYQPKQETVRVQETTRLQASW